MENGITIIWNGNIWKYLKRTFTDSYAVKQISARNLEENIGSLVGIVRWKLHKIFDDRETIQGIIRQLKKWERIIYGWRAGKLLDYLVDSIHKECPEQAGLFYIFWINGFQDYGDDIPRLVLNHAIKERQLEGEAPMPFTLSGRSCFYHPNPTDFDRELVENAGFDIEPTSEKRVFLKALYLKSSFNAIVNSICIADGYRNREFAEIWSALAYFKVSYGDSFLDKCIWELYWILRNISPGLISEEELRDEVYFGIEKVSDVVPSSVTQFYPRIGNEKWWTFADYEGSDVRFLLGWILKYAQEHHISTPTLYTIHKEIVNNWSRLNGVHINPNLGYFGYSPMPEWYSPIVFDTGVRKQ